MKKFNCLQLSVYPCVAIALLFVVGCNSESRKNGLEGNDSSKGVADSASRGESNVKVDAPASMNALESDTVHGHQAGAHGGIMVSLGRDSYHVEAVVDSEGSIRLYTLGKDESRVIDVESQTLKGFVKADGDAGSVNISFEPSPQDGDADNRTSLFVGIVPQELVGKKLDVTIPNIRIAGERFRLGFQSGQESHDQSPEMPDKVADGDEKDLYLTPGGRYTAADIAANGNVTASQKFKGFKSVHDMNPKAGDLICPITETKANPQCTWIVDGKSYEFCCPPCVDEFLKTAKSSTEPLADPATFVKK